MNASYDVNDETVCRSLGINQINLRHNAVNLALIVYDILRKFNVLLNYVFAMISDNAKNAVSTADVLDFVASSNVDSNIDSIEETHDDTYSQSDEDELLGDENDIEMKKIMDNAHRFDELLDDMSQDIVRTNDKMVHINHINCGTHTLQLAVNDAIKDSNIEDIWSKARQICIDMRTQIVMIEYRKLLGNKKLPPMDNATRWNSRFVMVNKKTHFKN